MSPLMDARIDSLAPLKPRFRPSGAKVALVSDLRPPYRRRKGWLVRTLQRLTRKRTAVPWTATGIALLPAGRLTAMTMRTGRLKE